MANGGMVLNWKGVGIVLVLLGWASSAGALNWRVNAQEKESKIVKAKADENEKGILLLQKDVTQIAKDVNELGVQQTAMSEKVGRTNENIQQVQYDVKSVLKALERLNGVSTITP